MHFSSPYLVVMNKSETVSDTSVFPYGSIAISAKENLGIETLRREILRHFSDDFIFCDLFVPYEKLGEYGKIKSLLKERNIRFGDDGQTIQAVIPAVYADKFTPFIAKSPSL